MIGSRIQGLRALPGLWTGFIKASIELPMPGRPVHFNTEELRVTPVPTPCGITP